MPQGYRNQVAPLGGEQGIGTGWSRFGQGLFGGGTPGSYETGLLTGFKANKLKYDAQKSLEAAAIETMRRIGYQNMEQHARDLGIQGDMARGAAGFLTAGGGTGQSMIGGALDVRDQQTANDMAYVNSLGGGSDLSSLNLMRKKPIELSTNSGGLQYGKWDTPGGRNLMNQTPRGIADIELAGKRGFAAEEQGKLSRARREHPEQFRAEGAKGKFSEKDERDIARAMDLAARGIATPEELAARFDALARPDLADKVYKRRAGAASDEPPVEGALDEDEAEAAKKLGFDPDDFGGAGAVNSFLQGQPIGNLPDEQTAAAPAVGDLPPPRVVTDPAEQEAIIQRATHWANQPGANIPMIEKLTEMQYGLQIKFGQPSAGGGKVKLRSKLYGPK